MQHKNLETNHLKRVYMKAKRRGLIELDLVMGYVADTYLYKMSAEHVAMFEHFLDMEDNILYKWVMGYEAVPEHLNNVVWYMIRSYNNNNIK